MSVIYNQLLNPEYTVRTLELRTTDNAAIDYYRGISPYIDENALLKTRISHLEQSFIKLSKLLTDKQASTVEESIENIENYFLESKKDEILKEKAEKDAFERLKSISDQI